MKKGRHRRFEEARALKRVSSDDDEVRERAEEEPCAECGAQPGHDHSSWCLAEQNEEDIWTS